MVLWNRHLSRPSAARCRRWEKLRKWHLEKLQEDQEQKKYRTKHIRVILNSEMWFDRKGEYTQSARHRARTNLTTPATEGSSLYDESA